MLNILNFDQVLRYIFGNDSKIARQISDRQRKADNATSDDIAALSDEWAAFLSRLGGGEMQGQQLLRGRRFVDSIRPESRPKSLS